MVYVYSDYMCFNIGNQSKGYNSNSVVNKNYNIVCFYTDKTVNDINFTTQLLSPYIETNDCFITYDYIQIYSKVWNINKRNIKTINILFLYITN
jgi:hypothetical protein